MSLFYDIVDTESGKQTLSVTQSTLVEGKLPQRTVNQNRKLGRCSIQRGVVKLSHSQVYRYWKKTFGSVPYCVQISFYFEQKTHLFLYFWFVFTPWVIVCNTNRHFFQFKLIWYDVFTFHLLELVLVRMC